MMEGTRPLLAEVQGLVSPTSSAIPGACPRASTTTKSVIAASGIGKAGGILFSNLDAYINVVGGLRLDEPAADLPVALALISSLKDTPVGEGIVAFGEIGLAGELRGVSNAEARVYEAARLGFTRILSLTIT